MNAFTAIIGYPLGWVMWLLYNAVSNYGVALLLFTLFARLVIVPTSIKQQKSTAKMAMLRPQQDELTKKYKGNKKKLNEEIMNLYKKEGYNPMSGCLPLLIQFPILFGIIDVIYKPLTHILRIEADIIDQLTAITTSMGEFNVRAMSSVELMVLRAVNEIPEAFSSIDPDILLIVQNFVPKMRFLGMDLMETPNTAMFTQIFTVFNPVLFVPVLSGLTSLMFSFMSLKTTAAASAGQPGAANMKVMMMMMPVFSVWITFSFPAGIGLYWIYSNMVGVVQSFVLNKIYNPKEMAEKYRKESEEKKERERLERIEAKKKAKESGGYDESASRRLAEARRRDAEKYGEAYDEAD